MPAGLTAEFGGGVFGGVSGTSPGMVIEAFGYAHANAAGGIPSRRRPTSFPGNLCGLAGSGLRLWAILLWQGTQLRELPVVTATGYNAAGQAVVHVKLVSSTDSSRPNPP